VVKDSSDEDEDDVLPIGTTFEKRFPGYGNELWEGTIVRYDPKNQKPYQGEYTRDGFLDWYTYAELMKCKVQLPSAVREESEEEEEAEEEEGKEEEKEEEEEEEEEEEVFDRGQRKGKKRKATTKKTDKEPRSKVAKMEEGPEVEVLLLQSKVKKSESSFMTDLHQLIQWRTQGILTDQEFQIAKQKILRN